MVSNSAALRFFSPRTEAVLSISGCVGALGFLILFGLIGLFREGSLGFDFVVFHDAGVQFLKGGNPWLLSIDSGAPFSYPPHLMSFISLYGALPFEWGLAVHTLLNLVAIASIAYLANFWVIHVRDFGRMTLAQGIALAFVLGNPYIAHSVYEGQWTLPAAACVFMSWHLLQVGRIVLAGVFLGLATIKPQVSVLYILWLVLAGHFRPLFIGAGTAGVLLLPALVAFGIEGTLSSWFASMEYYMTQWANIPGTPHVVGVEGLMVTLGVNGVGGLLKVLSVVCLVALFIYRQCFSNFLILHLFIVIALTFIYGHDTDYVSLSALWSYFVILAFRRNSYVDIAIAAGLLLMMFFPQRFIRMLEIQPLNYARTLLIPIICWIVWRWESGKSFR